MWRFTFGPTRYGNGSDACYHAGRAIGSFFPTMVGFVSQSLDLGMTIALFSAVASGIMIVMLLLPETRGRSPAETRWRRCAAAAR